MENLPNGEADGSQYLEPSGSVVVERGHRESHTIRGSLAGVLSRSDLRNSTSWNCYQEGEARCWVPWFLRTPTGPQQGKA
jgi:hypothetical protein